LDGENKNFMQSVAILNKISIFAPDAQEKRASASKKLAAV
jgi:hypothetical protein